MQFAVLQHSGTLAVFFDVAVVVRHKDHGAVLAFDKQLVVTFLLEAAVAHGHHFVN